jgi:hypothetical protein
MQEALPLILFLVTVIISALIFWKMHKARIAAWAEFASRHDMYADGLRIEGTYEGYPLRLETQSRGSGKSRYTVTVLYLTANGALPPDFSLEPEGFGDKLLKLFGQGDPEIGDEQFDKSFDLGNLTPATTRVLRHRSVQQHLYEMVTHYRTFHIHGDRIQAERSGIPSTVDALEEFTGPALMLAHTLEQASQRSKGWTTG